MKRLSLLLFGISFLFPFYGNGQSVANNKTSLEAPGKRYRPIVLNEAYEHNKWGIEPIDLLYQFAAYTSSFDSDDDNNGDGKPDIWGIPEWVAFEIKKQTGTLPKYRRPSPWLTDDTLCQKKIAPDDATYAVSGTNELKVVTTNNRFVRGHMCPKNAADRVGEDAGYNTHTVLNAVPQLQAQNNGIWKYLEEACTEWADKYGRIWVISGPAFFKQNPSMWLGQAGTVSIAIPDAIYKIVIRENKESETGIETLAFLFPNVIVNKNTREDIPQFITSIEEIERVTKLTFLTALDTKNQKMEKRKHEALTELMKQAAYELW